MNYKKLDGTLVKEENSQDRMLGKLYGGTGGRYFLKMLSFPFVSRTAGRFMDSWVSTFLISSFVKKNGISMKEYEKRRYASFNQFFTRKLRRGRRKISFHPDDFAAPCDGRLSVYPIRLNSVFRIKGTEYTIHSLLKNKELAEEYAGGTCLIYRLTVGDYHRYCYVDDALKQRNRQIAGRFYTVHPSSLGVHDIYKENTREYCILHTENFGKIVQVEVGALFVGKIKNYHKEAFVTRGQEKGRFEYGGSTIVLLVKRDQVCINEDIVRNTLAGYETEVHMGDTVGWSMF